MSAPATYLSRHEEIFESQTVITEANQEEDILETMADTESQNSSGSQYLQDVLGDVLAEALSKVAKERPSDPIQYVANYLHSLKKSPMEDQKPEHRVN